MSLRVVGYTAEGRRIVLDEGPSGVSWSGPIRGSLIEGGPGAYDRQRQAEYQRKHLAKKRAEG